MNNLATTENEKAMSQLGSTPARSAGLLGGFAMRISLPSSDSLLRELFEVSHLAELLDPAHRERLWPCMVNRALPSMARFVTTSGAQSAHGVVVFANGDICLVRVGKRGGHKRLWKFGRLGQ